MLVRSALVGFLLLGSTVALSSLNSYNDNKSHENIDQIDAEFCKTLHEQKYATQEEIERCEIINQSEPEQKHYPEQDQHDQMPVRPVGDKDQHDQMPVRPVGDKDQHDQMPVRPVGDKDQHDQMPVRPVGDKDQHDQMPVRPVGDKDQHDQMPVRPVGDKDQVGDYDYGTARWVDYGEFKAYKLFERKVVINLYGQDVSEISLYATNSMIEIQSAYAYLANGEVINLIPAIGSYVAEGFTVRSKLINERPLAIRKIVLSIKAADFKVIHHGTLRVSVGFTH